MRTTRVFQSGNSQAVRLPIDFHIDANDLWIAAHALAANLILVTNNTKEFARIKTLPLENWAKALN